MTVSASCPNHMNPPLSYIDPSYVSEVNVMAGITPVSMGGDSIGGTILVDSAQPVFARPGERVHNEGAISTFYRGNGQSYGASLVDPVSTQNFSFGYSGSWTNTDDYTDGRGHRDFVLTLRTRITAVTLAAQGRRQLICSPGGTTEHSLPGLSQPADGHGRKSLGVSQLSLPEGLWLGRARHARVTGRTSARDEHWQGQVDFSRCPCGCPWIHMEGTSGIP